MFKELEKISDEIYKKEKELSNLREKSIELRMKIEDKIQRSMEKSDCVGELELFVMANKYAKEELEELLHLESIIRELEIEINCLYRKYTIEKRKNAYECKDRLLRIKQEMAM